MQQGILPTREVGEADIILLNSCSVREKAAQKAYSRLGEYRLLKRAKPDLLIGFCGCVAQQEGEKAVARVPDIDFVIGPARVGELQSLIAERRATKSRWSPPGSRMPPPAITTWTSWPATACSRAW